MARKYFFSISCGVLITAALLHTVRLVKMLQHQFTRSW